MVGKGSPPDRILHFDGHWNTRLSLHVECWCIHADRRRLQELQMEPYHYQMGQGRSRSEHPLGEYQSKEDIRFALKFWLPNGITATAVPAAATYIGWWYQRDTGTRFYCLVRKLEGVKEDSTDPSKGPEAVVREKSQNSSLDDIGPTKLGPEDAIKPAENRESGALPQ
jgi:hypothetical protein